MSRLIRFERFKNGWATSVVAGLMVAGLMVAAPASSETAAPEPTPLVIEGPMPTTADELLQEVIKGWRVEKREDAERERTFANAREDQRQLLAAAKAVEATAEALSQALEKEYQDNEVTIAELEEALEERLGNLGELFGVTRQIAGDTRGNIEASITTAQYGRERVDFLEDLGKSKALPSIAELERLWHELVREMVEQGKVVEFEAQVYTPSGIET
ncbi:MAG: energy transducer TonB, partial [Myxococcota bacterium]